MGGVCCPGKAFEMDVPTAAAALAGNLGIVAAYVLSQIVPAPWDDDDGDDDDGDLVTEDA